MLSLIIQYNYIAMSQAIPSQICVTDFNKKGDKKMSIDLDKMRERMTTLKTKGGANNRFWRPPDGESVIRIVATTRFTIYENPRKPPELYLIFEYHLYE